MKITLKGALLILSIILLGFVMLPHNFSSRPTKAPQNECINQLRRMDGAKQQWAIENHKTNGPVNWNDILPYLWNDPKATNLPRCPKGGTYTLGSIEEDPTCSVEGHKLPIAL